ncbi:MAG TPA: PEGA domain-containing protein [Candidatus Saccharimonadales bacterium]|jgi:hypothetical protein
MTNLHKRGILIVIILVVIGGSLFLMKQGHGPTGTTATASISITYSGIPDTQGISVTFNSQAATPTNTGSYQVNPGTYTIDISKPGYQTFTTQLTADAAQSYTVNAQLQLIKPPAAISSIQQLNTATLDLPQAATIAGTNYFYNNTWAVVLASAYGSNAVLVAEYNLSLGTWDVVLGPGTSFTSADMQQLPEQVSGYLAANNYVN